MMKSLSVISILTLVTLTGCATGSFKDPGFTPPEIPTSYYYDTENGCYYTSIESNISPVLDVSGKCSISNLNDKPVKNIRFRSITKSNTTCEYVLAAYENGKTLRLKNDGSIICHQD